MMVTITTKDDESKVFDDVATAEINDNELIVRVYIGEHATKAHRFEGGKITTVYE